MEEQATPTGVVPFPAKLATALAKAQRAMGAAAKDRTADVKSEKGAYKYTYATLAAVWEAIREPLTSNGLAVVQQPSTTAEGVCVRTTLVHESGEYVDCETRLPVAMKTPQAYGSAISYARRYGLSALVGVVTDDDDDGAEASKPATKTVRPVPSTPKTEEAMVDALQASIDVQKSLAEIDAAMRAAPTLVALKALGLRAKKELRETERAPLAVIYREREAALKASAEVPS